MLVDNFIFMYNFIVLIVFSVLKGREMKFGG